MIEKVVAIDQSDGLNSVLNTISDKDWVVSTLIQVAEALFGDSVSGQEIVGLIRGCAETITVTLAYIFAMAIAGFIVSFFVIMVAVRKSMTKTGWIKAIVFSVLDTALFALFIWIYMLIKPGSAWVKTVVNIVYVIGIIVFSFLESYVFHGIKKVKVREVVNVKNLVFWIIGNTLVLLIGIGLTVLPVVLVPWYGGIILAIPFIEIVFLVIHINAESYVRDLILTKNKEPKQKQIS